MKIPEVFVLNQWNRTINYILYKLTPNEQFILKTDNNSVSKLALESVIKILCEKRGFYKKIKKWTEQGEIKVHLMRIGVAEE